MSTIRKISKRTVEEMVTCLVCLKLMINPTTLPECLHTFCKECIYGKIINQGVNKCPICQKEMGNTPLHRLRPDHLMTSLISKLVQAYNQSKENPKKKLKSKTHRTNKEPDHTIPRKQNKKTPTSASKGKAPIIAEDEQEQNIRTTRRSYPNHSVVIREPIHTTDRNHQKPKVDYPRKGKAPLVILDKSTDSEDETYVPPTLDLPQKKPRGQPRTTNFEQRGSREVKVHHDKKNKNKTSIHAGGIQVNPAKENRETRMVPIWVTLLVDNRKGCEPLPQIQARFLRIKDSSQPISILQKFIRDKFGLGSEDEIEIRLFGETLLSSMKIYSLIELYSQKGFAIQEIRAKPGDSGEDYVMILYYGRKSP